MENFDVVNIDQSKCIGCGQCVDDCITENIELQDGKAKCGRPCILCGHCVAICPSGAVSIPGYEMSDVEVYNKDRFAFDIDKLLYTIKFRRSIRHYKNQPVEHEKLEHMVKAGRYTATGSNRQACRFVVVQEGMDTLKEMTWSHIGTATENPGNLPEEMVPILKKFMDMRTKGTDYLFRNAPVAIYIAAESAVDAALAAQNMEMAAISQGLGVLYDGFLVMASKNPAICEWLDIQDKPVAVCMLVGYPQKSYKRTAPRRTADVRWR